MSARPTRWVRDLLAMCEIEGAVVLGWEKNKHIKIRLRTPYGERMLVASGTTTDPHSIHNNRSIVRRMMKVGFHK